MAINRRDFLKVGAAAGAAALLGWYVNRVNDRTIGAREVPGSGEVGHFSAEQLGEIDVDAYLAACSRCGVCITECPFQAIKSVGWQLPQLTDETRSKCPGYDVCGACFAVCPTSALSQAMEPLRSKYGIESGIKKAPWWKGKKIDKTLISRPDEVEEGGA
jgi:ferredoxin